MRRRDALECEGVLDFGSAVPAAHAEHRLDGGVLEGPGEVFQAVFERGLLVVDVASRDGDVAPALKALDGSVYLLFARDGRGGDHGDAVPLGEEELFMGARIGGVAHGTSGVRAFRARRFGWRGGFLGRRFGLRW